MTSSPRGNILLRVITRGPCGIRFTLALRLFLRSSGRSAPGSVAAPRLAVYLNMGTLIDLPVFSVWPGLAGVEALAYLKEAGFEGTQDGDPADCRRVGTGSTASGRVDRPGEAELLARKFKDQ